jgi:LacI family transcriptional regulator
MQTRAEDDESIAATARAFPEAEQVSPDIRRPRPPQLRDVARAADVSISVASRALNRDPNLRARETTIERVFAAARELQYRANAAGRSLRTRAVGAIGVILPDVNNPFFSELLSGIEEGCDENDVMPLFGRAERLNDNPHLLRNLVNEGRADGFLIQPTDVFPAAAFRTLAADRVSSVFLNSHSVDAQSSVVLDDRAGIALATRHLLDLGHRRVGFVGGLPDNDNASLRREAFEATMAAMGLTVERRWVTDRGFAFADGQRALGEMVDGGELPSALVVATHNAALGVLRESLTRGIDIPTSLSVVSLHDSPAAAYSWPALTSVRMPLRELGRRAVSTLLRVMDDGIPRHEFITDPAPHLVMRESTRERGQSRLHTPRRD